MLNGYKAKIGAVGAILMGLALVANAIAAEKFDARAALEGATAVFGGLSVFGLRVAINKVEDAVK